MSDKQRLEEYLRNRTLAPIIEEARRQRARWGELPERNMELESALCSLTEDAFQVALEDAQKDNFSDVKEGLTKVWKSCQSLIEEATPPPDSFASSTRCSLFNTYNHAVSTLLGVARLMASLASWTG